jgi:excisionase family DNA binding protein
VSSGILSAMTKDKENDNDDAKDKFLLRPAEAANLMGCGRSKIYELIASGQIPSLRIGSSVRVPTRRLLEWIDASTRSPELPQ